MSADDVRERVARGVAVLDDVQDGWRDRVDPDAVRVESLTSCVLGQVFGHYFAQRAQQLIFHSGEYARSLGFDAAFGDDLAALNAEWRRTLEEPT